MQHVFGGLVPIVVPVVALIAVFTFVSVTTWAENRRKEREAYYRSETLRKAVDQGGDACQAVIDMMREEELRHARRRIEGLRLGGLVTLAVGVGVMVFLYFLIPSEAIWLAGLIPFLIGLVLAIFGYTQTPAVSAEK
jgi:hypothetical protein